MTDDEIHDALLDALCEFPLDECEKCGDRTEGAPTYLFSDGGYEPRDGTYLCEPCARKWLEPDDTTTENT